MKEINKITYNGKNILTIDYSNIGELKDNDKKIQLIQAVISEYAKYPPKSVLALINVKNLQFDIAILEAFKESQAKTNPYKKKEAIIGMSGPQKVGYQFISGFTNDSMKAFDTEQEAKEWLTKD
jgi:hypothetical protein